ncbi:MAG: hypothetical protein ACI9MC_002843 [Kiritimatiellia bacterium]|jgi:hypothetical protein
MSEMGVWSGAIVALGLIWGAVVLGGRTPTPSSEPHTANTTTQHDKPDCSLDAGSVAIQGKADPGLGNADQIPVVPIYRGYVPARVHLLACPSVDTCRLPDKMPVHLYTGVGPEPLHKHPMEPTILSRGRCMEFSWSGRADLFWPHAPEGVVRWAVVLDSDGSPKRPAGWRDDGRAYWASDVVYAGSEGSPTVH